MMSLTTNTSLQAAGRLRLLVRLALLVAAALLIYLSVNRPWWGMLMYAPQYPDGLGVTAYLDGMAGDVTEIDNLNHYIGMMPLADAAKLELAAVRWVLPLMVVLAVASVFVSGWAGWALRAPLIAFPALFLIDLTAWMWYAGNHLDPHAPMNRTIARFTPTVLGEGRIAQFITYGYLEPGFWLAFAAAALALAAGLIRSRPGKAGAP